MPYSKKGLDVLRASHFTSAEKAAGFLFIGEWADPRSAVNTLQKAVQPLLITCTAHLPTELSWLFLHNRRKTGSLSENYGLQELCRGGVWLWDAGKGRIQETQSNPHPESAAVICRNLWRYIEGGGKSVYRVIGDFCSYTLMDANWWWCCITLRL